MSDAYLRANFIGIAPHVSGPIIELPIVDNQRVAEGDLTQKMALDIEGQPVKGEFLRIGTTVNSMVLLITMDSPILRVKYSMDTYWWLCVT